MYKQKDNDSIHGKIRYRLRKDLEKEGTQQVKEWNDTTML